MKKFEITEEQQKQIADWLKNVVYPEIVTEQKRTFKDPNDFVLFCWEHGFPYEGAIGGGITYCFTPNNIGESQIVRYGEYKLDVTNYDEW